MKNKTKHIIKTIEPGSIAEELELEPGDELLRVNGEIIEDVFDYHFQTNDTYLELTIRKKDGEEWDLEIEKEYDEEIGITFENEFMDQYRSCSNNCIFCFIDQMPPGMRPTLYFKDMMKRSILRQCAWLVPLLVHYENPFPDVHRPLQCCPIKVSVHPKLPNMP